MTISDAYLLIIEGLELSFSYFLSPNKRIYFGFLLSSIILAFWVFKSSGIKDSFFNYLFNRKVWVGASPTVDYGFFLFNGIFKVVVIGPVLIFGLYLSFYIKEYLLTQFGYPSIKFSPYLIIGAYTVVLFLFKDFSSYVVHLIFHKVPFLWRFHKVHHSATVLNPLTQYRIHPVELLVNNLKGIVVVGMVTGVFDFLSNGEFSLFLVLGVNIIGFTFMLFGANLRHSHVKLRYPSGLENWLISPVQHQIHHSQNQEHFDRNFGSVLAIWDSIFGTLFKSKNIVKIQFGLGRVENKKLKTFWQNLVGPFHR
jgi:sterol desaturase/sphingolipid hydroxylase (fatty acid hydroxylase superfamily)